ncbi:MAG: hypothetical protein GY938_04215 [Ketobacter sp.]|nr:hypothetical protein [Ketobacter sp.]
MPEEGFVGYDHNLYSDTCGFRLVQVTDFMPINHEDDYGKIINSHAVTYYAEGANKPPRDCRHKYGDKEILKASFYAWFPEEFDAVNRAQGILPPYDRWTVEDLCVFQADRRDAYKAGHQKYEESMQPYSQGWYKLAKKIAFIEKARENHRFQANSATNYAQRKGWMNINWSNE